MKYYIIAGENSGDLYGSYLMDSLTKYDNDPTFFCWGGDCMEKKGGHMIRRLDKLSFMGFWEVFKNGITILNNFLIVKKDIKKKNPDVLILIDYPGFNLRVAKFAKQNNIKVLWFIAPQIWAWKESRIKKIKKYIDRMYVVLPFEKDYFKSKNLHVQYFGHPLTQILNNNSIRNKKIKKVIALFPGSRKQEVKKMLPIMLKMINYFRDYRFIIGGVNNINLNFYKNIIKDYDVKLVIDQTYKLMSISAASIVSSGTISLEAAMCKVPQVVCYKTSFISFIIAKKLIKTKYISLVNIILNRRVIDELIQDNFNSENLIISLEKTLNKNNIKKVEKDYNQLIQKLNKNFSFNSLAKDMFAFCNQN